MLSHLYSSPSAFCYVCCALSASLISLVRQRWRKAEPQTKSRTAVEGYQVLDEALRIVENYEARTRH
jgi:hypothetical protein